ncbi:MAG: hypothetical protein LBL07_03710, partial [Tannerella sp.]|nr:hypothetical protein [Tannerella sp.]
MKKILLLLLLLPMLTSCFTTRYVSEEPVLKKQFMNAHVAAVEFDLGDPDEVRETNRGYEYVYLKDCPPGDCYRLFAFNGEDQVVGIKSTERV